MINLGGTDIKGVAIGSRSVSAVYAGAGKVWPVGVSFRWMLVQDSSTAIITSIDLSDIGNADTSLQVLFFDSGEAYDVPKAKIWTEDADGNVLGVVSEPTNVSGSVVTADDLYIDEDTANVVCQIIDSSGNTIKEESIPVVA